MKIVWSGIHEPRKNLSLLIRSVARMGACDVIVDVIGDGKMNKVWRAEADRAGIGDRFRWHGWIKRDMALEIVSKSDVFVITSIHDLTSTVLLEALSLGKPVVSLDHCGFSDVVDETCGIKVPVGRTEDVVAGFSNALSRLRDASLRRTLAAGAMRRAAEYSWERKQLVIDKLYRPEWKKILVCVYACSPYRGSEPGMGWNYLRLIAKDRQVWAIVECEKWEPDIKKWLSEHPGEMENVHFTFIRKIRCRWLRSLWPPSYYWFYRVWHWRAYRAAIMLDKKIGFDCVHQLNMVGFREPGYMWKLPLPLVWGPVGGLGLTDWRLLGLLPFKGKIEFFFRNLINIVHAHILLRPRIAARKAASTGAFIMATGENQREAKHLWGVDSIVLCEVGS